jgi:hypothetical protein
MTQNPQCPDDPVEVSRGVLVETLYEFRLPYRLKPGSGAKKTVPM